MIILLILEFWSYPDQPFCLQLIPSCNFRLKAGDMGVMQAEPRLQPKKHRRQSRKQINQSVQDELYELDDDEDDNLEAENPILRR